jgi:flagellar motor protein MotB
VIKLVTRAWLAILAVALMLAFSGGCVSQKRADDLQTLYRRCQDQVQDLRNQLEECRARVKALQAMQRSTDPEMLAKLESLTAERDRLAAALAAAAQALRNASLTGPALPAELDDALRQLAAENPDLMTYDPRLGMIKFNADLTFALGSATVNPQAKPALAKLAGIVNRPVAQRYEVRIVGHTDNVPIKRAETRAQHPTNWHLSVHRSIAVKDVLADSAVAQPRMSVAGYGEHHPIAPNGRNGAQANRRVEIYLVASTYQAPTGPAPADEPAAPAAPAAAPAAPAAPAPPPATPDMFK